ncbi:alpha/beta hydrolase [Microbacterium yannicii]|uniref:Alpha/beta hydrolase n=1 Tax=Microbacterium yannicii TaxID=671622 RepID=A0ABP9LZN6_9MICO|nr:alpha/beta hydrolase [Microbacterium yannicii]MCO5954444.1 alpha/beta hydrolase [Microbacterium yannicii]
MTVDPQVAQVWAALIANGFRGFSAGSPEDARAAYRCIATSRESTAGSPQPVDIRDIVIRGIPARIYRPESAAVGVVAYFHGGGYVVGDLDTHDLSARLLCVEVGAVVISVDYRRAPEHRYPAASDDAATAVEWIIANVARLGAETPSVAVAGDSAGGNLAAVVAQRGVAEGWGLAAQALMYPNVDFSARDGSMREHATAPFLTRRDIEWFFAHYTGVAIDDAAAAPLLCDPGLNPLTAQSLSHLCPAVIATADCDPLRDQGAAYARALALAGTPTVYRNFPGLAHGFYPLQTVSRARDATAWFNGELRRLLLIDCEASGGTTQAPPATPS